MPSKSEPDFKPIPASNKKGASAKVQFWIMPEVKREIDKLFKSLPYENISDLYRHAVVHYLDYLSGVTSVEVDMPYVHSIIDFLAREKERLQFEAIINELEDTVGEHEKRGRLRDAKRVVRVVKEAIEKMPDGSLKDRYRQMLVNRYGYLTGQESNSPEGPEGPEGNGVQLDPGLMIDN